MWTSRKVKPPGVFALSLRSVRSMAMCNGETAVLGSSIAANEMACKMNGTNFTKSEIKIDG